MRIISGILKGRKLAPIRGQRIRPSSDFVKEALFNVLGPRVLDAVVLDLFAGTGSLGIEALSRGAASAVFVDSHPQSLKILHRNIATFALEARSTVIKKDILRGLGFLKAMHRLFDLAFMDPPYDKGFAEPTLQLLDAAAVTAQQTCIVVEHSITEPLPERTASFELAGKRQYGKTLVSFYESVL